MRGLRMGARGGAAHDVSQIHYSAVSPTHGPVDVQTGWDRMTQSFHLTVWRMGQPDVSLVEDCLCHPLRRVSDVCDTLQGHGIPLPIDVIKALVIHAAVDAGNVVVCVDPVEERDAHG